MVRIELCNLQAIFLPCKLLIELQEEVVTPKATPSVTKSASEVALSSDEEEKDEDEDEDDDDEEAEEEDDEEMEEEDDVASTSKHHDSAPDSPSVTHRLARSQRARNDQLLSAIHIISVDPIFIICWL